MFIRDVYKDLTGVIEVLERLRCGLSTVVQMVVVVVVMTIMMIKVFGCSIEESGFVRVVRITAIEAQDCYRRPH